MLFLPDCSTVIWGAPRLVVGAHSLVAGAPRCFQVNLKAPASVLSTLGFDHPGILVRQLSNTPRGSQWHNYILLMWTHQWSIQTELMRKSGSASQSIRIRWEQMIPPRCEDVYNWVTTSDTTRGKGTHNCVDPPHHRQSDWDQKLRKIECVFLLYDQIRWKWDDLYVLCGLQNIYSPSLCSPPSPLYLWTPAVPPGGRMWRPWSSLFGNALGGLDWVNSEIHLEAVIEGVGRYTCRLWSNKIGGVLGGS